MAKVEEEDSVSLFDRQLLKEVDLRKGECKLHNCGLAVNNPGDNLVLRPLCSDDYEKGFVTLLSQLTKVGDVTKEMFLKRFHAMRSCAGTYYLIVLEDTKLEKIVASGTLIVEQKFIHEAAVRGRIEDIVVDNSCRGKKIGKLIVETLILLSERIGCYKTSLECKDPLLTFYTQFGLKREDNQNYLCKRFFH
ncbi:glucosamine 6-phosphate N-acetyltransferase-like [Acropora millepora]|uniref:glucosamine 6-phosphate N-acetyltransferase-like n=1 Tax=Acropora millepora TaxID=45264 RepID=UPI0010FC8B1F|nr:glucosamine 6-phosphate N-acetyltransferase-like [Acropora millepora]